MVWVVSPWWALRKGQGLAGPALPLPQALEAAPYWAFLSPRFPTEIHSGLLEVISPSPHFYPDFSRLRESFGDPKERVRY